MNVGDRLRDLVVALVEEIASRPRPGEVNRRQAIVVSTATGPNRVNLKLYATDPQTFPARYLSTYVPSVNDVVWVDFVGPDPLVIGKLA